MCNQEDKMKIKIGNKIRKIDRCLYSQVREINETTGFKTLACCCGHGKYPKTIFIQPKGVYGNKCISEWYSKNDFIPTKTRYYIFYSKDKEGIYFPLLLNQTIIHLFRNEDYLNYLNGEN